MAIDTPQKRRSALGIGLPGLVLPFPDGSIDAVDRALLTGVYLSGTGTGEGGEETVGLQQVTYITNQRLSCAGTNNPDVILLVTAGLVAPYKCSDESVTQYPLRFVEARIVEFCEVDLKNDCTQMWKYLFVYDGAQLVPGTFLKSADIGGIFCRGPLVQWIEEIVGNEVELKENGDGTLTLTTQHGCTKTFFSGDGATGILEIDHGGTGADNAMDALINLGFVKDTWTPTVTGDGNTTIDNLSVDQATYYALGPYAYFVNLAMRFTIVGNPGTGPKLFFGTPLPSIPDVATAFFGVTAFQNGIYVPGAQWQVSGANQIAVFHSNLSDWTAGPDARINLSAIVLRA